MFSIFWNVFDVFKFLSSVRVWECRVQALGLSSGFGAVGCRFLIQAKG